MRKLALRVALFTLLVPASVGLASDGVLEINQGTATATVPGTTRVNSRFLSRSTRLGRSADGLPQIRPGVGVSSRSPAQDAPRLPRVARTIGVVE